MKIEHITSLPPEFLKNDSAQEHHLLREWKELAGDRTLLGSDWLLSWWMYFGDATHSHFHGRQLCLLAVRDESGLLHGLAPWYVDRSFSAGGILRYLGSGIVCTDYLTVLTRAGSERTVAEAVADWLCEEGADVWERIELVGTDDQDEVVPYLMKLLSGRGSRLHKRPGDNTWRLDLPPRWEDYLADMSARRRNRVRKFVKTEFDTGLTQLEVTETETEFEINWAIFERLHQARRQSVGDPGVFSSPDFAAFLRTAGRRLFANGELDLLVLRRDGQPISVEFNPTSPGVAWGYQGGMDPTALEHRPGHLMTLARVRRGIETGKYALDFMRGDERYKEEWGGVRRTTTEYRLVKPRPLAQLRHGVWLAGQQFRQFAKSGVATAHQVLGKGQTLNP